MSRRTALVVGVVAWLACVAFALPDATPRGVVVWALVSAVVVTLTIVVARTLSRALTKAVLK